jgi:hypothetical protein
LSKVVAVELAMGGGGGMVLAVEAPYWYKRCRGRRRRKERIHRTVWISILWICVITSLAVLNFKLHRDKFSFSERMNQIVLFWVVGPYVLQRIPTFRRRILPPSSGLKCLGYKKKLLPSALPIFSRRRCTRAALFLKWRQNISPKHHNPPTGVPCVAACKSINWTTTTVGNWKHIYNNW